MTDQLTRRALIERAGLGAAALTVPAWLAACGGSSSKKSAGTTGTAASKTLAKTLVFSNWPLYIDVNEKTKKHPSLDQFTQQTGVKVKYIEDINDNDSFFGKIEGPLSQGQSIGRDLIVTTDPSALPRRMTEPRWLEKRAKSPIPNIKTRQPVQPPPGWDPNRRYSRPRP